MSKTVGYFKNTLLSNQDGFQKNDNRKIMKIESTSVEG